MLHRATCLVFVLATAACGSTTSSGGGDDGAAGTDAPTGFVEAAHGNAPQLVSMGGSVLAHPAVRPIFFANDADMQAKIEQFLAQLASGTYWSTVTSEYGVGALTIEPTIVSADTPPATDDALHTWLANKLDGTDAAWGALEPDTIYSVFYPSGPQLTGPDGNACQDYEAYHDELAPSGAVYAVMPRCEQSGFPVLDDVTISVSHELAEAATDPHVESTPAFGAVDDEHAIWGFVPGAENGDFCEYLPTAYGAFVGEFQAQRLWSNASAAAGHDPCLPAPATPYMSAAPMFTEDVTTTDGPTGPATTKGVEVPVGMTKTIDVALFSDAPTEAFTVTAYDAASENGDPAELQLSFDRATGKNGDTLHLSIKRLRAGSFGGSELMIQVANGDTVTSQWWAYAAN